MSEVLPIAADVPLTEISLARRAVQLAVNAQGRADALNVLRRGIMNPRLAPEAWCLMGRLHAGAGKLRDAAEAFRNGLAAVAEDAHLPAWGALEFGRILVQLGDAKGAEKVFRDAADKAGDAAPPALLGALGNAVLKAAPHAPDTEAILRRAILALPQDRLLVEAWFDRLRAQGSAETALAWLEALQMEASLPLRGALVALAEARGRQKVREHFAGKFAEFAQASPFLELGRVWQAMIDGVAPRADDAAAVLQDQRQGAEFFFQFLCDPPRQLRPLLKHKPSETALLAAGVQLEAMQAFIQEFMQYGTPEWRDILDQAAIREPMARAAFEQAERESGFLDRIVTTGTLPMMDPFSGEIVEPIDSVIVFGRTVYAYRGRELFFLICGKPWSGAAGLYVPRLNLSLPFGTSATGLLGDHLPNVQAVLLKRYIQYAGRQEEAAAASQGRRELVLSVGGTENFAHHIWNFYSAIERLIRTGKIGGISRVIFSGTEFFGPLDELFPELKAIGVERPRKNNVIDPVPYRADALVLPTGGFFVARSLSQRIIDTMRRTPRIMADAVEPADIARKPGAAVVWMAMRLRDKAWADQENGSIRIIQILARRFPDALFLLDGFSFPVGRDQISDQWADVISALKAMGERIRQASGVPDQVVNMVGNTLRESVLWAQEAHVYLAPYGTTQHKVGWFTSAPGIVYVPPNFSPDIAARSPACAVAEMGARPNFIFADAVSAGERRGLSRARERFANVALDAESIADQLTVLLEEGGILRAKD